MPINRKYLGTTSLSAWPRVPWKVTGPIILIMITQHIQYNQEIRPSQQGFVESRSCLTNRISFNEYPWAGHRKNCWCCLPGLQQSLWYCLSQHCPWETMAWIDTLFTVEKKSSVWLGPKSYIQMMVINNWSSPEHSTKASSVWIALSII